VKRLEIGFLAHIDEEDMILLCEKLLEFLGMNGSFHEEPREWYFISEAITNFFSLLAANSAAFRILDMLE
jgi:hypothetical protein